MKKISINLRDPRYRIPAVIILLVGAGVYYWFTETFTPIQQERILLQSQLKQKQDTLRVIQALKPQLNLLKNEVAFSQRKLDSLKSIFPDQKEIPKLIREITAVARASGITTTKFNPLPDVEREYYIENKYAISVEGGYHALADFYAFLANFTLIINLSNMQISTLSEDKSKSIESSNGIQPATTVAMFEMTTFSSKR
jgi:type IV pilus assembly protein PilO